MAITLDEQRQAFDGSPPSVPVTLRQKVRQALFVQAQAVLVEVGTTPNHANRAILARQILFGTSDVYVDAFLRAAIAANAGAANLAAVTGASDAAVQTAIGAAFDNFANGQ